MASKRKTTTTSAPAARPMASLEESFTNTRALLLNFRNQMAMALPRHVTPDRMVRLLLTECRKTPELMHCTRESFLGAVIQMAQLGLEPGVSDEAYLIPYKRECTLIPGYKGLLKLARNSGVIGPVKADVVREKDHFRYLEGTRTIFEHQISSDTDRGQLTHAWARAFIQGFDDPQIEVMTRAQVLAVKASSKAGDRGPWKTHEEEMWKKTVVRRLCKMLPSSTELQTAVKLDELAEAGIPQHLGEMVPLVTAPAQEPDEPEPEEKPEAAGTDGAQGASEPDSQEDEPGGRAGEGGPSPQSPQPKPGVCPGCGRHESLIATNGHGPECPEASA